jgi:ribonuclease VapC
LIVVDTSALIAILLREPLGAVCLAKIEHEPEVFMSAGTLAEAYIVAISRNIGPRLKELIDGLKIRIIPLTAEFAYQCGEAHREYGKGRHRAGLNYGDCFSYAAAKHFGCSLLFVGDDFSQTDLQGAI